LFFCILQKEERKKKKAAKKEEQKKRKEEQKKKQEARKKERQESKYRFRCAVFCFGYRIVIVRSSKPFRLLSVVYTQRKQRARKSVKSSRLIRPPSAQNELARGRNVGRRSANKSR